MKHLKLIEIVEISKKIGRYEFEISSDLIHGLNPWGLEIETARLKEKLNKLIEEVEEILYEKEN